MKDVISIQDAKTQMMQLNVVIYGTIRDIEEHFFTSFSNLENISNLFAKSVVIIFENDSTDNTRAKLIKWSQEVSIKMEKHIILKDNLIELYPLRAHRLAYCRNCILNYIYDNNYHLTYDYAIHCDLDNRFWSIDYTSICSCFQYNPNSWDAMTCVNKNKTYYDFWALRCDQSWFNINIFSCDAENVDYNSKIEEFENLLKNTNGLIQVTSSFNGLGVYKLSSIINCRYNADYFCNVCNNANIGCKEDNDHIGLHKQMINNGCTIFINNKMYIQSTPKNSITYEQFIKTIKYVQTINKDPLLYLLVNNFIETQGKWIMDNIDDGYIANIITNYYDSKLYAFHDTYQSNNYTLLNKNVVVVQHNNYDNIHSVFRDIHDPNEYISFLYIDSPSYENTKILLHGFRTKIKNGCVILFKKLINYKQFFLYAIKALYEFIQEYEIQYEWNIMNGVLNTTIDTDILENKLIKSQCVSIKIINNPLLNTCLKESNFNSPEYLNFDWVSYITYYSDLSQVKTKEEAFLHWINYGKHEGRIVPFDQGTDEITVNTSQSINSFDWNVYLELNRDLKEAGINTREDAYFHWINHGIKEGRLYKFDWCTYINSYGLLSKSIDTKIKAINHWLDNEMPDIQIEQTDYEDQLFDWKYYKREYADLKQISSPILAWSHWITYGKKEGRKCHNFNWTNYLLLNSDLIQSGINNKILATEHWINHGKKENRKYVNA